MTPASSQHGHLAWRLQCVPGFYPHPVCSILLGLPDSKIDLDVDPLGLKIDLSVDPLGSKIDLSVDPLGSAVLPPDYLDQSHLSVNPWDSRF